MTIIIGVLLGLLQVSSSYATAYHKSVPATLKTQLEGDFAFLASIKAESASSKNPASPYHQQVFGNIDGSVYQAWFDARVLTIGVDSCGGGGSVTACVFRFMPKWMYITSNYVSMNLPQIVRLSILMHEARHNDTEAHGYPHDTCPTPFRDENGNDIRGHDSGDLMQGLDACDAKEMGSYGIQLIWLKNLADHCANCNEKTKADAKMIAVDTFSRILTPKVRANLKKDLGL